MKIKQLSIFLQNKEGSLYDALEILTNADINIKALSLADTSDFGILRIVVDDPEKGIEILKENNFLVKPTEIVAIEMDDSPGGLSSILGIIKKNNIDLEYLYAFTHNKADKAILLLHTDNLDELVSSLEKEDVVIVSPEEVYNL
ncbi:MAG: acetolactate synthase [Methanobrevibacter sp.]|uniref:acetolactate synthase n=1 Tax=Methanobrevibacter sp. TaxID=66852 RepID=UPI0026E0DEE2|nr:acetolactate synthase [Methanobrevibacter sp.]MDO5849398.1 acetolactate synthase [Methanobrevibacter sp.]